MVEATHALPWQALMKNANQKQLDLTFAGYLVAGMLQRSGANFRFSPNGWHPGAVEFIVLTDATTYQSIKVKYSEKPAQVRNIWRNWTHSKSRGSDHLVVVTGRGKEVFAEPTVAPLLALDNDTSLSVLN